MKTQVEERFTDYFEKWMSQIEDYMQIILKISKDESHGQGEQQYSNEELVEKLTTLHKDYYTAKWAAAHEDVLAFFSPVWLTPLEKAYQWITGWKPSTIFRMIDSLQNNKIPGRNLDKLSEEQVKEMEGLKSMIKVEEEMVEREMERQQVAVADRKKVELARLASRMNNGEEKVLGSPARIDGLVEAAIAGLLLGLERVMKMADCVRLKALKGVLDVLSPKESVDFFASFSMMQIQLRKCGKEKESKCCN